MKPLRMSSAFLLGLSLLLFEASHAVASTVNVVPAVTLNGSNFLYSYQISYTPDANEGIYQFDLFNLAGLVPNASLIASPLHWSSVADFSGNNISWISDDPAFDIFSIPVTGFSFQSTLGPGMVSYQAILEDSGGPLSATRTGSTTGPVNPVPEPASALLLCAGLAIGLLRYGCRETRTPPVLGPAGLLWAGLLCASLLVAAPAVSVSVKDSPPWAPDISIRAGRNAQLDASGSTGIGLLTFSWTQLSGPNTLRWVNRATAQPTISGAIFGTYVVRVTVVDSTGAASADLRFGAVATDDAGVVTPPNNATAFLFSPMIRWGASPWPWLDERHRALADGFAAKIANDPQFNAADWDTALSGSISGTLGFFTVTGTGTQFQTDLCGGAGNTAPVADRQLVVWYTLPGGGTGRRNLEFTGCPSQTSLSLRFQWPLPTAESASLSYSRLLCFSCWTGGSNYVNYYDVVLSYYGLYLRSGRSEYRDTARVLASRWFRSVAIDEGRVYPARLPSPRDFNLLGLMWWAVESNQPQVWPQIYPALDAYVSYIASVGTVGDPREEGFVLAYIAAGAALCPDAVKRQFYASAIQTSITNRWIPSQAAGGVYPQKMPYQPGTVNVVNGSDLVTVSGFTLAPSFFDPTYSFWVAYDNTAINGDIATYLGPTYVNVSQFRLPRPYEGASANGRPWQYFVFAGQGVQPFFQGIVSRAMDLAHRATGDPGARKINQEITNWLLTTGAQNSTGGFYYGRVFRNCEPIQDAIPWCSYNASIPLDVSYSRYNLSLMLGGFSGSYATAPTNFMLNAVDFAAGSALGRLGGPQASALALYDFDTSLTRNWFKDLGIFFGYGQAYAWPAARTGTPTSKLLGR